MSIGEAANKVGATIAEQVSALSPQPRDDGGRFAGKTPAPETRSLYDHPVVAEDAIHQQLLGLVQKDGTPEQWPADPVKAEMPKVSKETSWVVPTNISQNKQRNVRGCTLVVS